MKRKPEKKEALTKNKGLSNSWDHYWFDFELRWTTVRFFFFYAYSLLGIDFWEQIQRGHKYSTDFNVPHFLSSWNLNPLLPSFLVDFFLNVQSQLRSNDDPPLNVLAFLVMSSFMLGSIISFRIAFGVARHYEKAIVAFLWSWCYFISQVNDYQHHYMLCSVLFILSLVDLNHSESPRSHNNNLQHAKFKSWPLRLLLVLVAIVYIFTVITKIDPLFLDGTLLQSIVSPKYKTLLFSFVQSVRQLSSDWLPVPLSRILTDGLTVPLVWRLLAYQTIFIEISLAILMILTMRVTFPVVFFSGIFFHFMLDISGISIGKFSFWMIGFFLLFMHGSIEEMISKLVIKWEKMVRSDEPIDSNHATNVIIYLVLVVFSHLLVYRFVALERETVLLSLILLSLIAIIGLIKNLTSEEKSSLRVSGILHFSSCVLVILLSCFTSSLSEHHLGMGRNGARLGNINEAIQHYEKVIKFDPYNGDNYADLAMFYRALDKGDPIDKATGKPSPSFARFHELNEYVIKHIDQNNIKALVGLGFWFDANKNRDESCSLGRKIQTRCSEIQNEICHHKECGEKQRYSASVASNVGRYLVNNWCTGS